MHNQNRKAYLIRAFKRPTQHEIISFFIFVNGLWYVFEFLTLFSLFSKIMLNDKPFLMLLSMEAAKTILYHFKWSVQLACGLYCGLFGIIVDVKKNVFNWNIHKNGVHALIAPICVLCSQLALNFNKIKHLLWYNGIIISYHTLLTTHTHTQTHTPYIENLTIYIPFNFTLWCYHNVITYPLQQLSVVLKPSYTTSTYL